MSVKTIPRTGGPHGQAASLGWQLEARVGVICLGYVGRSRLNWDLPSLAGRSVLFPPQDLLWVWLEGQQMVLVYEKR